MSPLEITASQVIAQVRAILAKNKGARTIGIRTQRPWRGGESLSDGGHAFRVRYCASSLAFREQLVAAADASEITILLTPLDDKNLGDDVLARLWRPRLDVIQSWRNVRDLLGVDEIDTRLNKQVWMAEALLQTWAQGDPPVPGRVLTAEFTWQLLLKRYLGFDQSRVDAIELARWAKDPDRVATYQSAPAEFRAHLPDWMAESSGEVGRVMLAAMESEHGCDLIPLGLVCQVVFDPELATESILVTAAARLEERFLKGKSLPPKTGRGWGAAVAAAVEADLAKNAYNIIQAFQRRAEDILDEIKAGDFVGHSPILPKGLEQRLESFAQAILVAISANPSSIAMDILENAAQSALGHRMAGMKPHRAEGVHMAVRLVRWLLDQVNHPMAGSFQEAVLNYYHSSGFVDWARSRIWDGDSNPSLAHAYGKLAQRVDDQRETENRNFGRLIQDWSRHAAPSPEILWIEELLGQVVVPLANRPILLLVLDGMSVAVFRELIQDLSMQGWVELGQGESGLRRPVIAALPTCTEVSRASLLCGQITSGDSAKEKDGFSKHPGLRSTGRSNFPPLLYHKGELTGTGGRGLSPEVRATIASMDRRVIGVVINSVDDHLAKGDQFRESWTIETIVPLSQILEAARDANRVIILTSDHGHVLEHDLAYRPHGDCQERCRPAIGQPAADEVILQGPRVWSAGEKIIAPWSEKLRYATKKYGYHGGVSPQEVVVPLAIFHSGSPRDVPDGWTEVSSVWPPWWERSEPGHPPLLDRKASRKIVTKKKIEPNPIPNLFSGMEDELADPNEVSTVSCQNGGWIALLLQSQIYLEQKQMGARTTMEDGKVRGFLELLEARGGKMTRLALANTLAIPRMRFPGILASLRRLLNVDGYPILEVNENTDMVELNKPLLFTQFEIMSE